MNNQLKRLIAISILLLTTVSCICTLSLMIIQNKWFNNYSMLIIVVLTISSIYCFKVFDKIINGPINDKIKSAGPELLHALLVLKKYTQETSLYNDRVPPMETVNKAIYKAIEN